MIRQCNPKKEKPRHRINLALDGDVWERFQPVVKKKWEESFNSWVEFAMTCYIHEECDECPYMDEEEKGKGYKPYGIGKSSREQ